MHIQLIKYQAIFLIFAFCMLGSCVSETKTYKYKINVELNTPDGVVSGSTVRQIEYREKPFRIIQHGQAVMLNVRNKSNLFILMDIGTRDLHFLTFYWRGLLTRTLDSSGIRAGGGAFEQAISKKTIFKFPDPQKAADHNVKYPTIVYFEDINDPSTVRIVDPKDMTSSLGSGYSIKKMTLKMTDDPVSTGISKEIPWLDTADFYRTIIESEQTSAVSEEKETIYHHNFIRQ